MRQHESKHGILHEVEMSDSTRKEGSQKQVVKLRPSKTGVAKLGMGASITTEKKKKKSAE